MQSQIRAPGLGQSVNHVNRPVSAPTFGPRTCPSSCHRHQHKVRGISLIVRAEDYYSVLGVEKGADKKTIKQAYRQKARKYHPDVNKEPGAEDTFKRIGEAYEVLSDDNKRAIYDRYGEAGLKGGMGGMGGMGADGFSNPMDIFEQFFGGGFSSMGGMGGMGGGARSRTRAQQGEDERVELQLDFLEAVFGAQKEITVERLVTDPACGGSGMKAGTAPSTCPQCGGRGTVMSTMRTPLGVFQSVQECPRCNATGQIITPCEKCGGDGRISESKKISIKVPAGVDNGSRLRVRGEGNAGRRGGEAGDMYVYITVKEHPEMRREGNDIHSDIEVSYVDAILGTQHKVTTVDGPVELRIPPGTQPGTTLLMNKRGVPRLGNTVQRGDHHVHVRVKIPKQLSSEERKLVEELKELQSKAKVGPFRF